jgi:SWI/SNF-related matrix-associated actin-dependent regulator of chromatin subfamily A-like protein 1
VAQAVSAPQVLPFQRVGSQWLAATEAGILADPMRMGKTIQAIRGSDLAGARHVLVACPAIAAEGWRREFLRWQQVDRSVGIVTEREAAPATDVVIVAYNRLTAADSKALYPSLRRKWGVLVNDEAQALKNPQSKRTRAIYGANCDRRSGLSSLARQVWSLSGTIAPNHPGEMWSHANALFPAAIGGASEAAFEQRFCQFKAGFRGKRSVIGGRNLDELRDALGPHVMRREYADVLPEFPPLIVDVLPVASPAAAAVARMESSPEFEKLRMVLDAAYAEGRPDEDLTPALAEALAMVDEEQLSRLDRLTGVVKAEIAVEVVRGELEGTDEKIVLFALHKEAIDRMRDGLRHLGVVVVDGRVPQGRRQELIDKFQNDPSCRVFIGQILAAGTAIALWAARSVLMVEADWVPSNNEQAMSRCRHMEQKGSVLARFLSLVGSLDEVKTRVLARKTATLDALFANQGVGI